VSEFPIEDLTAEDSGYAGGDARGNRRPVACVALALVTVLGGGAACERKAAAAPQKLTVTSKDYTVNGEYVSVPLDRVDGLKVERGRLVVKGAPADVVTDIPPSADLERITRHWALVTDAHVDRHRLLVFTEAESVKDVSIELPDGEAPLHFDVFAMRDGGEILVFATGDRESGPPSLYGYIVLNHK
jgi:hypothetical protein